MLLVAALLCLGTGLFVALSGEEPRARLWFALLSVSCAAVCAFLFVETHYEEWAFFAARMNMTAAYGATAAAVFTIGVMCRIPVGPVIQIIVVLAGAVNLVTVWLTNVYFTGQLHRYAWGIYAVGDPLFMLNPLLVSLVAICAWVLLIKNLRQVHPLDRNRAKYLVLAYTILGISVLDYLPHFGVDLFGGSISALCMPLFAIIFGYACLRYRLIAFRDWVARAAGWFVTAVVVIAAYALVLEADRRWIHGETTVVHAAAALIDLALFGALGTRLPRFLERVLGGAHIDFHSVVEKLSGELMSILDEGLLSARMMAVCRDVFGSSTAAVLAGAEIRCCASSLPRRRWSSARPGAAARARLRCSAPTSCSCRCGSATATVRISWWAPWRCRAAATTTCIRPARSSRCARSPTSTASRSTTHAARTSWPRAAASIAIWRRRWSSACSPATRTRSKTNGA